MSTSRSNDTLVQRLQKLVQPVVTFVKNLFKRS